MKANPHTEQDIELMLQQHARHCREQQLRDEMNSQYSRLMRRVSLMHYGASACGVALLLALLWTFTPPVMANATSRCSMEQRNAAIATSDKIIQSL